MRNSGTGGMQTAGAQYSLYCPICGKPAARKEITGENTRYMHYTKKGTTWHAVRNGEGGTRR